MQLSEYERISIRAWAITSSTEFHAKKQDVKIEKIIEDAREIHRFYNEKEGVNKIVNLEEVKNNGKP